MDKYIYNEQSLFSNFIENLIPLLKIISKGILLDWSIIVLLLALKNCQKRAILFMIYVFNILEFFANLISLAKLNNIGFYWNNKIWNLYNA